MKYQLIIFFFIGLIAISCKSKKREIKIQFSANGNKYEIVSQQSTSCNITYNKIISKNSYKAITNEITRKVLEFKFFGGYNEVTKDIDPTTLVFNSIVKDEFQKEMTIIYEITNESHNATGIECFMKISEQESCKFILDKAATNKFKVYIKIDKNYGKGTFSGVLTSNTDGRKVFITDGYFENIPFLNLTTE